MSSPAFQFYPADYLADMRVRMLSWAGRGLYMDLLCYCWREGYIPADSSAIAQLSGCHDSAIIESCLALFEPSENGRLIHPRLEKEREKQAEYSKGRVEAGHKGAKKRWGQQVQDDKKWLSHSSANGSATVLPLAKNGSSSSTSSSEVVQQRKRTTKLPDDDWIDSLQDSEAYQGLDVRKEASKAKIWADTHNRKFTRRFLTGWLGRAEPQSELKLKTGQPGTAGNPYL